MLNTAAEHILHNLKNTRRYASIGGYSDLLTIRTSGDMLELSSKTAFSQAPDEYRKAVIRAGQFLQAIDLQSYLAGEHILIQSFPSFNDDRLIATVRLVSRSDSIENNPQSVEPITESSVKRVLTSLASHHSLLFSTPDNFQPGFKNGLKKEIECLRDVTGSDSCFFLASVTDNPFIWLKTGQWIEETQMTVEKNPHIPVPLVMSDIGKDERLQSGNRLDNCNYCQAFIIFKGSPA